MLIMRIVFIRQAPESTDARRSRHIPDADKPGDSSGEATPVPIPNTEVKLSSAEDTERAAFRENRSSPGLLHLRPSRAARPVAIVPGSTRTRRLAQDLSARAGAVVLARSHAASPVDAGMAGAAQRYAPRDDRH